jgi:pimeloyl-ACP methyl ester carboxylesterase
MEKDNVQASRNGRFYERGSVRIYYEEVGKGFPLLVIPGGGLNSRIDVLFRSSPFNPFVEFGGEYRVIAADLRNAPDGQSTGPVEADRPWESYAEDQLGLMDQLGIDRFMVIGFCIGGPLVWNLLKRAPDRVVAGVLAQPSGVLPSNPEIFYERNIRLWAPELLKQRSDLSMEPVDGFLTKMYRGNPEFVITVTRDFVRTCQTPLLIMPDDIPEHPYEVAMESAMLALNAQVSMFPWAKPPARTPLAVRHVRSFLRASAPAEVRE